MVFIIQIGIGQGAGTGKSFFGCCNTDRYRRIDLGEGFLAHYLHVLHTGIGSALDTALDIVFNLTDRRRDTGCDSPAAICGVGKGKIHAAGHLDVAAVSPVIECRSGTVGVGGCIVDHQGVYITVALVQGKAKGHTGISAGTMAVVGHGNA